MIQTVTKEAQTNNLTNFIKTLITDSMGENIIKECKFIYPLNHVVVRKVKMLKKPKFDITKLNEMYSEAQRAEAKEDKKMEDDEEAQNLLKK